jgi:hypothetical protein
MSLTVSPILKQQFRRRSRARIWYGRLEHELDVDDRGGADHRSGPDIPGMQVKSVCSARGRLFTACKAHGEITGNPRNNAIVGEKSPYHQQPLPKPLMPPKRNQPRRKTLRGWQSVIRPVALVAGQHGLLRHQMLDIDPKPLSDPTPICRVRLQKMPNLLFLNMLRRVPQAPDDIADQALFRIRLHQTEEIPQHKTLFEKSVGAGRFGMRKAESAR